MEPSTWIMAAITFASVVVALYSVWDSKRRYIDSIQPIISFKLSCQGAGLYLEIINTGKSPAHNLIVKVIDITEADFEYDRKYDLLSGISFDLYPDEVVCNQIAMVSKVTSRAIVTLYLSYMDDWEELVSITRTVSLFNDGDPDIFYNQR